MGDNYKSVCSWWSSSSSSVRLLWIIIPLVLVSGFVALLSPKSSSWVFISPVPSPVSSEILVGQNENITNIVSVSSKKGEIGGTLDRNSRTVGEEEAALSDESSLDRSASPAADIEALHIPPPVEETESKTNVTAFISLGIATPTNESHKLPARPTISRKPTNLMKLEARLGRVRVAIGKAKNNKNQIEDPDFVPTGPMYWNANAFHRSYLEMEKQFKIFVYDEGEPPVFHTGPCRSIYAMEGNFINAMELSQFRTRDPEKAHVFFLPFSITSMVRFVYVRESHDWAPMRQTVRDYVNLIQWRYQYWNRSLGADHFMLACHDWGPELSASVPYLYQNSIRALCNANTSEGFNPAKDVSIPEILLPDGTTNRLLGGPSPSKRPVLAFFAGGVHGPIRPILLEHWENKDNDIQVHKYLPKGVSYNAMLRKSKFCLSPSGYEVASPRMVEALYMGCVPVLIKDHYVSPFSDVLNWKSFSVVVAVEDIPKLKIILMGISQRQYIRLQRRGLQVRRHFEVNFPPKRFDVFHMILHSIWLRRLNVRVRSFEES